MADADTRAREMARRLLAEIQYDDSDAFDEARLLEAIAAVLAPLLTRAETAERERDELLATYRPGHTDLMVGPETLDEFIKENPLPNDGPDAASLSEGGDNAC